MLKYLKKPADYSKALENTGLGDISVKPTNPVLYNLYKKLGKTLNIATQEDAVTKR